MIRPPQRSVTRFLIPFIDVLILLLCIFLLMPFVSRSDPGPTEDVQRLKEQLSTTRNELDRQRTDVAAQFGQFRVVVLDIAPDTGELVYWVRDGQSPAATRMKIDSEAAAARLIGRERLKSGDKILSFLIRFPQEESTYPLLAQLESYRKWFKNVPMNVDIDTHRR